MKYRFFIAGTLLAIASFFSAAAPAIAQAPAAESSPVTIHVLEREDCSYCQAARAFFDSYTAENPQVTITYHDVVNSAADRDLFRRVSEAADVPKVTPIIIVGDTLLQGFASEKITGAVVARLVAQQAGPAPTLAELIETTDSPSRPLWRRAVKWGMRSPVLSMGRAQAAYRYRSLAK